MSFLNDMVVTRSLDMMREFGAVAASLGVFHAVISRMAAARVRRGLLVGRRDERDRRQALLCLTEEGRSTVV